MGKVSAYAQSKEGNERMKKCIQEYSEAEISRTAAGSKVRTVKDMQAAAQKFINIMKSTALNYNLPDSVMAHINGLEAGNIRKTSEGFEIPLFFAGDLHRDSLENDLNYDGIDNIVALFNNGYHASNYVYGWWRTRKTDGGAAFESSNRDDFAWVRSKKDREALHFIQQAITDFNANYGAEYDVTAVAGLAYE